MAKLVDSVVETTQTTGTGTLDLLGAETGYRAFSDALNSGDQTFYAIEDDPSAPTVWEYGIGTWTTGSPATLSRDEVLASSNSGSKISLQSGATYTVTGVLAVRALQDGAWKWLTGAAGTNTITANASPALTSYKAGQEFNFVAAGANTGAATLDVDSVGVKDIKKAGASGLSALAAGDIQAGHVVKVVYDGTQFVMTSPVPVPSNLVVDTRSIASGNGLTGGGDLSADRTLAVGAGTGIVANADDVAVDKATQANMEGQTANKVVTADVMKYHPALPKAWAYFNVSAGTVTVQASYGITSISRSSAGRFVVTFSTAFSDANYALVGSASNTSGGAGRSVMYDETQGKTSTTCGVLVCDETGNVDASSIAVVFYGDQ